MDTDLNLLFGVLAMQLELIDSRQFADACSLWSVDKSRSLADILRDQKWISRDNQKIVEDLVQRKLKKHGGDPRETLGAEADIIARDSMRDVDDEDVNHTLSYLPPSIAHVRVGQVEDTLNFEPETRSRYTLTRVHGEGGVGRVWRAHDSRLNRQVALKEIRPDRKVSQSSWQRFIKEAQVTGQLEHPNIVPVYEMTAGAGESEETFYTMRFVNGRTLGAEITEYRRRRRAGKARPLDLRRLLQAFCGVCNAMAYAHSRGVVHRDLKPANVMLGPFGEVVVLDWGLAKMVDEPEPQTRSPKFTKISVSDEANAHETVAGNVLGTLTYMAPEQAAGRLDLIDRRTDIYGLGAILFALVAGRHPHSSKHENTEQIRERIIHDPSPLAHEVESSVPKALSAICAKAMQKERQDRYQSAQAIADDVQRWLADEPIECYRESFGERLGRITRRHRTLTQTLAASLLVITIVTSIALLLIYDARKKEQIAKQEAISRLHEARRTVDRYLTSTADVLHYFPGARALRSRLLEQAALDYENFINQASDDLEIQAETARAWGRLGDLRTLLGQEDKAEEAYIRGATWLRDLLQKTNSPLSRMELAYCLSHLADLYRTQNKVDPARELLTEAQKLAHDSEQVAGYRLMKGHVFYNQGLLEQHLGKWDAALSCFKQAESSFLGLVNQANDQDDQFHEYRNWLAKSRALQGQVYVEQCRHVDAVAVIEQAIHEYELLVAVDPDSVAYLEGLSLSQLHLANAISVMSREEEQQAALREAIAGFDALLMTMPDVDAFRQNRGVARASYGTSLSRYGYNVDAEEQFVLAFDEFKDLYENRGQALDNLYLMAETSVRRAQLHRDVDDDTEAEIILKGTIRAYETELLIRSPHDPVFLRGSGVARRQRARLYFKAGELAEARKECELAMQALDKSLKQAPDDDYSLNGKAIVYEYLADIERADQQSAKANGYQEAAVAIRDRLPPTPEARLRLIKLLGKSSRSEDHARAVQLAQALSDEFPEAGEYATALGAAAYLAGDVTTSISVLKQVEAKRLPLHSDHEFWLALAYLGRNQEGDLDQAEAAFKLGKTRMQETAPGKVALIELRRRVEQALAAAQR